MFVMSQPRSTTCEFIPWSSQVCGLPPNSSPAIPPSVYCLVTSILTISYWLVIELTCEVYLTFKRHDSLYFWSIVVSIWGVALRATGWTLQNWVAAVDPYMWTTFMIVGGTAMATRQTETINDKRLHVDRVR